MVNLNFNHPYYRKHILLTWEGLCATYEIRGGSCRSLVVRRLSMLVSVYFWTQFRRSSGIERLCFRLHKDGGTLPIHSTFHLGKWYWHPWTLRQSPKLGSEESQYHEAVKWRSNPVNYAWYSGGYRHMISSSSIRLLTYGTTITVVMTLLLTNLLDHSFYIHLEGRCLAILGTLLT